MPYQNSQYQIDYNPKRSRTTRLNLFPKNCLMSCFLVKSNAPLTVKNNGTPIRVSENTPQHICQLAKSCEKDLIKCPKTTRIIAKDLTSSKYKIRLGLIFIINIFK